MIKVGEYNTLFVDRKSDLGYMLNDGNNRNEEVLLHFRQADKEYKDGDKVEVFIYADKERRPTATCNKPFADLEHAGFVKVVDAIKGIGVFVDINTPKQVLVSKDFLPWKEEEWPQKEDTLLVRLKERAGVLTAKPLNRYEIDEVMREAAYEEMQEVDGFICKIAESGVGIVTNEKAYVFVPKHQLRGAYRIGQAVKVTITKAVDKEYYGKLNAVKEVLVDEDMKTIIDYLEAHNGVMYLSAKSSAEDVEGIFNMSRKAFKRALGGLYKEHIVICSDDETKLVKKENE